jgi:hypothetical protein
MSPSLTRWGFPSRVKQRAAHSQHGRTWEAVPGASQRLIRPSKHLPFLLVSDEQPHVVIPLVTTRGPDGNEACYHGSISTESG